MVRRTRMQDMDAAKQAYQFGRNSFRRDLVTGRITRNPYLNGTLFHRAFEDGREHERGASGSRDAMRMIKNESGRSAYEGRAHPITAKLENSV